MDKLFDTVPEYVQYLFEEFSIPLHQAIYYYEALNNLPHIMDSVVFYYEDDKDGEEVDFWNLDEGFLITEYPEIAKVAAFFFGVSEQAVLEQDETIGDQFLEDEEISSFFTTAWDVKDRIRGGYFKGLIGRRLGFLTEGMSLNDALSPGGISFESRYDYADVKDRLLLQLRKDSELVPGLFYEGQELLELTIHTEHFVSYDIEEFINAFLNIVKRVDSLFHKAISEGLTEEERIEYDFYVLTLGIKMIGPGPKYAFYRNIVLYNDYYKDHQYDELTSYLRFDFWHYDYYQPWRCMEFTDDKNLAQKFFDLVPEAKKQMREFAMDVRYFECTYVLSNPKSLISEDEEEPTSPEVYYIEKPKEELEDDYDYSVKLATFASPPLKGGIRAVIPKGRKYVEKNFAQLLSKYYKEGIV